MSGSQGVVMDIPPPDLRTHLLVEFRAVMVALLPSRSNGSRRAGCQAPMQATLAAPYGSSRGSFFVCQRLVAMQAGGAGG